MKIFYNLLLLFISISFSGYSQSYFPMLDSVSNIWYYTGNIIPVRTAAPVTNCTYPSSSNWFLGYKALTNGDTTIMGIDYKKLEEHSFGSPAECLFGYLREDTASQKVYFKDNTLAPEILLYDFSLQIGDSIYYDFIVSGYYQSGYFRVDSIGNINIAAGTRRIFYLRNYSSFPLQYQMQWIESVGHPGHLVFTHAENVSFGGGWFLGCLDNLPRDYFQVLTCFEHDSQKVYFDTCAYVLSSQTGCFLYEDSCTYYNAFCGSLNEQQQLYRWNISPNPAQDIFSVNIESTKETVVWLVLWDLKGVRVRETELNLMPGNNIREIDCSTLPAGIYAAEINGSHLKLVIGK